MAWRPESQTVNSRPEWLPKTPTTTAKTGARCKGPAGTNWRKR